MCIRDSTTTNHPLTTHSHSANPPRLSMQPQPGDVVLATLEEMTHLNKQGKCHVVGCTQQSIGKSHIHLGTGLVPVSQVCTGHSKKLYLRRGQQMMRYCTRCRVVLDVTAFGKNNFSCRPCLERERDNYKKRRTLLNISHRCREGRRLLPTAPFP